MTTIAHAPPFPYEKYRIRRPHVVRDPHTGRLQRPQAPKWTPRCWVMNGWWIVHDHVPRSSEYLQYFPGHTYRPSGVEPKPLRTAAIQPTIGASLEVREDGAKIQVLCIINGCNVNGPAVYPGRKRNDLSSKLSAQSINQGDKVNGAYMCAMHATSFLTIVL
jgi:hypothetical protein